MLQLQNFAGLGGGAARIAVRPPGLRLAPTAEADETGSSTGGSTERGTPTLPPSGASPPEAPAAHASGETFPDPNPGTGAGPAINGACADSRRTAAARMENPVNTYPGTGAGPAREGERKRKADKPVAPCSPAAAALVAAGASGCKRRQSPEAEVPFQCLCSLFDCLRIQRLLYSVTTQAHTSLESASSGTCLAL